MNAISPTWQPQGSFHHVGFVVASIPNAVQGFAAMLQAEWDEHIFHDPNPGVRVTFLKSRRAGDPLWELVEPADELSRSLPKARPSAAGSGWWAGFCRPKRTLRHAISISSMASSGRRQMARARFGRWI